MKIRPLNDRVLVIREEEVLKSAGGIIIPDTAKEKPQQMSLFKIREYGLDIPQSRVSRDSTFSRREVLMPFVVLRFQYDMACFSRS